MPLYEHVVITRQDISSQQVENITEKLTSVIEAGGGKITKTEYWGLRTFTYRIKKNRKGHYTFFHIDAPHEAVAEMKRQESLDEDVLRELTLRVDHFDEGDSIMMRRGGRDTRDDRRGRGSFGDRDRDNRASRRDRDHKDDRKGRTESDKKNVSGGTDTASPKPETAAKENDASGDTDGASPKPETPAQEIKE